MKSSQGIPTGTRRSFLMKKPTHSKISLHCPFNDLCPHSFWTRSTQRFALQVLVNISIGGLWQIMTLLWMWIKIWIYDCFLAATRKFEIDPFVLPPSPLQRMGRGCSRNCKKLGSKESWNLLNRKQLIYSTMVCILFEVEKIFSSSWIGTPKGI